VSEGLLHSMQRALFVKCCMWYLVSAVAAIAVLMCDTSSLGKCSLLQTASLQRTGTLKHTST
jgi:hypothetical protein